MSSRTQSPVVSRVFPLLCCCCLGLFATSELNAQVATNVPVVEQSPGGIVREYWTDLNRITVRSLTDSPNFPLNPEGTSSCADFEAPTNSAENYGQRMRGLLLAPVTGDYTFWIASDDNGELWLSTDDNPAHKHRIARVSLYTAARDWNRYPEQRSDPIPLEGGKLYYVEARHKQALGWENLSVAWRCPGGSRELITGRWLQPWNSGLPGEGITREVWKNVEGASALDLTNPAPDLIEQLVQFEATPNSSNKNFRQRLRGYIHPPANGTYVFWMTDAGNSELWLSTDHTPTDKRRIVFPARSSAFTPPEPSRQERNGTPNRWPSEPVTLEGGKSYYIEASQTGATTRGDSRSTGGQWMVGWQLPDSTLESPIPARRLMPYDSDYDSMPDWYEVHRGFDPHNPDDARAVVGSEGLSNLEEFRRASDPQGADASQDLPPLLCVKQIRKPEQVRSGKQARLKGVVTYSLNNLDFYFQDGTGGIYVEAGDGLKKRLLPGDFVEVEGVMTGEASTRNVALTKVGVLGREFLPMARLVALDPVPLGFPEIADFAANADSERVEIEGVVRSASIQEDWLHGRNLILRVVTSGGQFDVRCPEIGGVSLRAWVDAAIAVRGVAAVNPQSGQLVIHAPRRADIYIKEESSGDPFLVASRTIRSLLQFSLGGAGRRVKVAGTVLYSEPGRMLFLRDDSGALQLFTSQPEAVRPGERIEALGFPARGDYSLSLADAIFRKVSSNAPAPSVSATPEEILGGKLNCDLVTLRGTLVDYVYGSDKQGFWFKAGGTLFDAYWNATNGLPAASRFGKDSLLEITGIALVQSSSAESGPQTFHVLLPSAEAVTVLERAPWWTSRRLFWTTGALGVAILLGAAWVAFLSKKKKLLEDEIIRRKRAEEDLQGAHQELETRMTAELHDEISRREKTEAEFQAVLKERTRIAQELHDTLEQGLVGIALQLDNVADVISDDVGLAQDHLESARRLVEHSQAETRRSVWDLRSQNLEQGGLLSALNTVAHHLVDGTDVTVEVVSQGTAMPLPVLVENNLFRIGQEALTNALKHAQASRISVSTEYQADAVLLEIQDDGIGFDAEHPVSDGHHFGLQGIRERVKRLGGELELKSEPKRGTQIRVRVPLAEKSTTDGHG